MRNNTANNNPPNDTMEPGARGVVRLYLAAGLATAPRFMEGLLRELELRFRDRLELRSEGSLYFPYGDWGRSPYLQLLEIGHDLMLPHRKLNRSIGGGRLLEVIGGLQDTEAFHLFVGHSGGGVAALHAAQQLSRRYPSLSTYVVQIGSPKVPVPVELRDRTIYIYATNPKGQICDPICRLGSWGGWSAQWGGIPLWLAGACRPGRVHGIPIRGGHPDYFRTAAELGAEPANLELCLDLLWPYLVEWMKVWQHQANKEGPSLES